MLLLHTSFGYDKNFIFSPPPLPKSWIRHWCMMIFLGCVCTQIQQRVQLFMFLRMYFGDSIWSYLDVKGNVMMVETIWLAARMLWRQILKQEPHALFMHYYGHALSLSVAATVKLIPLVASTRDTTHETYQNVAVLSQMCSYLQRCQSTNFVRLCWVLYTMPNSMDCLQWDIWQHHWQL